MKHLFLILALSTVSTAFAAPNCAVVGNGKTYFVQTDVEDYSTSVVSDQLGRGIMQVRERKANGDQYWDDNNLCVNLVNNLNGCTAFIKPKSGLVYEPTDGGLQLKLSGNKIFASTGFEIAEAKGCTATQALLAGYAIASKMK
jgi:hypothetical protein